MMHSMDPSVFEAARVATIHVLKFVGSICGMCGRFLWFGFFSMGGFGVSSQCCRIWVVSGEVA